jgi:hypothetical protein
VAAGVGVLGAEGRPEGVDLGQRQAIGLDVTFAALLNERLEDLAFFDQRIEKGLVAKLEGIVGSEFVHMDYGEAIQKMLIV